MKHSMKRILSILLCVAMICGVLVLPTSAADPIPDTFNAWKSYGSIVVVVGEDVIIRQNQIDGIGNDDLDSITIHYKIFANPEIVGYVNAISIQFPTAINGVNYFQAPAQGANVGDSFSTADDVTYYVSFSNNFLGFGDDTQGNAPVGTYLGWQKNTTEGQEGFFAEFDVILPLRRNADLRNLFNGSTTGSVELPTLETISAGAYAVYGTKADITNLPHADYSDGEYGIVSPMLKSVKSYPIYLDLDGGTMDYPPAANEPLYYAIAGEEWEIKDAQTTTHDPAAFTPTKTDSNGAEMIFLGWEVSADPATGAQATVSGSTLTMPSDVALETAPVTSYTLKAKWDTDNDHDGEPDSEEITVNFTVRDRGADGDEEGLKDGAEGISWPTGIDGTVSRRGDFSGLDTPAPSYKGTIYVELVTGEADYAQLGTSIPTLSLKDGWFDVYNADTADQAGIYMGNTKVADSLADLATKDLTAAPFNGTAGGTLNLEIRLHGPKDSQVTVQVFDETLSADPVAEVPNVPIGTPYQVYTDAAGTTPSTDPNGSGNVGDDNPFPITATGLAPDRDPENKPLVGWNAEVVNDVLKVTPSYDANPADDATVNIPGPALDEDTGTEVSDDPNDPNNPLPKDVTDGTWFIYVTKADATGVADEIPGSERQLAKNEAAITLEYPTIDERDGNGSLLDYWNIGTEQTATSTNNPFNVEGTDYFTNGVPYRLVSPKRADLVDFSAVDGNGVTQYEQTDVPNDTIYTIYKDPAGTDQDSTGTVPADSSPVSLPDVPATIDDGNGILVFRGWNGVYTPPGTGSDEPGTIVLTPAYDALNKDDIEIITEGYTVWAGGLHNQTSADAFFYVKIKGEAATADDAQFLKATAELAGRFARFKDDAQISDYTGALTVAFDTEGKAPVKAGYGAFIVNLPMTDSSVLSVTLDYVRNGTALGVDCPNHDVILTGNVNSSAIIGTTGTGIDGADLLDLNKMLIRNELKPTRGDTVNYDYELADVNISEEIDGADLLDINKMLVGTTPIN